MKIYAVSDIHTDYKENMEWVEAHCAATSRPGDVLILAGDVSDSLPTLRRTLGLLASSYGHLFYTPGNHELWVRRGERERHDSLGKLHEITALCAELGVHIGPARLPGGAWVVPLWSWYHASWDREPDVPGAMAIEKVMMDFHACCWDSEPALAGASAARDDALARYFDALNDPGFKTVVDKINKERAEAKGAAAAAAGGEGTAAAAPAGPVVVSFSHFLPLQELLPEKRLLHYPNLAKACGSDYLAARVAALAPDAHVFGHTHFTQDQAGSDGVRYVQWPLGYPRDQRRRRDGGWDPLLLYDSEEGLAAQRRAYWSDYYRQNERTPHVVTPAPWVMG